MLEILNWFATGTTIAAAALLSVNLGRLPNGIAFIIFTISSVAWIAAGLLDKEASITTQNIVLLGINLIGIWRWLIRDPSKRKPSPARWASHVRRRRDKVRRTITGVF